MTFDALLIGHEAGVTSVSWRPQTNTSSPPTLLSTSTDSSLILWSPSTVLTSSNDGATLWINRQRFGDVGGQRLGGFVGGLWATGSRDAMSWGWNGGWRRWRCQSPREGVYESALEEWSEVGAITGHRAPVRSISWSPQGEYLISARWVNLMLPSYFRIKMVGQLGSNHPHPWRDSDYQPRWSQNACVA